MGRTSRPGRSRHAGNHCDSAQSRGARDLPTSCATIPRFLFSSSYNFLAAFVSVILFGRFGIPRHMFYIFIAPGVNQRTFFFMISNL